MKAEKNEPSLDKSSTLEQFQETVLQEQLTPLWMGAAGQLREPRTHIQPYLWHWKEVRRRGPPVAQIDSARCRGGGTARADAAQSGDSHP
jgi:gentisate 1,2-dioxygenase